MAKTALLVIKNETFRMEPPMNSCTVCLIAKNEERAILEWLAYQRVVGFDNIIVYDNGSTDNTAKIVQHAASLEPSISYIPWPDQPGRRPQPSAYADALTRCSTEWIAFFDTDEFILLKRHETIGDYLSSLSPEISGVAVNWLVFGSNGNDKADDRLVIERFTSCAMPKHGKNLFCKTIVRRNDVKEMFVHTAVLAKGSYADGAGNVIDLSPRSTKTGVVNHDVIQLNHYLLKSKEEFALKKSRGHASRAAEDIAKIHIIDDEFWISHDLNHREDRTILTFLSQTSLEMKRLGFDL
jgi:glycosyltransferase involved in cell wall biosynthesis